MSSPHATSLYKDVGKAILRLRKKAKPKMSQQTLASAAGVSRASIANIEQGRHRIQLHVLFDIAAALDVEPVHLLPHSQANRLAQPLPMSISKKLNTRGEALAVSRLLAGRKDATDD